MLFVREKVNTVGLLGFSDGLLSSVRVWRFVFDISNYTRSFGLRVSPAVAFLMVIIFGVVSDEKTLRYLGRHVCIGTVFCYPQKTADLASVGHENVTLLVSL
ncbi:hypothetical protein TNCV_956231 [Trichonephila clavipes]|nr:hypothetical protein TNCV_956231 [Trichonephila clavipes]